MRWAEVREATIAKSQMTAGCSVAVGRVESIDVALLVATLYLTAT